MLHGVVGFVPNRVDGDQSVQAAVVSRLVKAGARVSKQLGSSTTHVVFLQKLLPSFQEQVQQDDLIKDLYERLEKVNSKARIVSNLWVHASAESGSRANEDEFTIRKPTDPEDLNFYSSGMPSLKGQRRGSMRLPGMAQRRRKSTPLPLPSEAFAFDADDSLFSSSQQINELDARPRDAGAAPGCDDWAGDRPPGARLQGTKRSASTAQLGNAGAASSTRRRRTSLPALGAFQTLESSCSNSRPGNSKRTNAVNASAPALLMQQHVGRKVPLRAGTATAGGGSSKPGARARSVPQSSSKAAAAKAPAKGGVTRGQAGASVASQGGGTSIGQVGASKSKRGQAEASMAGLTPTTTPRRAPPATALASPASGPAVLMMQAANASTTPLAPIAPARSATPCVADTPTSLTFNGHSTAAPALNAASGTPTTTLQPETTNAGGYTADATNSRSIHPNLVSLMGGDARTPAAHHGGSNDSTPCLVLPPAKGQASTPRLGRVKDVDLQQQQQQQQQHQDGQEQRQTGPPERKQLEQPPQEQQQAEVRHSRQRRSSGRAETAGMSACLVQGPLAQGLPERAAAATPPLLPKQYDVATPDPQPAAAPMTGFRAGSRQQASKVVEIKGAATPCLPAGCSSLMRQGPSECWVEGFDRSKASCAPVLLHSPWQQQQQQQHGMQELQGQGDKQALEEHPHHHQQQQQQRQQRLRDVTLADQELRACELSKGCLPRKRSVLWADRLTPDTSPSALLPVNPAFVRAATSTLHASETAALAPVAHSNEGSQLGRLASPTLAPRSSGPAHPACNSQPAAPSVSAAGERNLTTYTHGCSSNSNSTHEVPATLAHSALNTTPQHTAKFARTIASAPVTCHKSGVMCKGAAAASATTTPILPAQPSARQPTFHSTGKGVPGSMGSNKAGSSSMPAPLQPAPLSAYKPLVPHASSGGGVITSTPQCAAGRAVEVLRAAKRGSPTLGTPSVSPRLSPLGMLAVPKLKGSGGSGSRSVGEVGPAAAATAAAAVGGGGGAPQAGGSPSPSGCCHLEQHGTGSHTAAAAAKPANEAAATGAHLTGAGAEAARVQGSTGQGACASVVGGNVEGTVPGAVKVAARSSKPAGSAAEGESAQSQLPDRPGQGTTGMLGREGGGGGGDHGPKHPGGERGLTGPSAGAAQACAPVVIDLTCSESDAMQAKPDLLLSPLQPQHQQYQCNQQQQGHSNQQQHRHSDPQQQGNSNQQQQGHSNQQQQGHSDPQQEGHNKNTDQPTAPLPPAQQSHGEWREHCDGCGGGIGNKGELQRCQQLLQALRQQQLLSPVKQQYHHLLHQQQQQQIQGPSGSHPRHHLAPQPQTSLLPNMQTTHRSTTAVSSNPQTLVPPNRHTVHSSTTAVSSSDAAAAAPSASSHTAPPAAPSHTAPPTVPSHTALLAAPSRTAPPAAPSHTAPPELPAHTAPPAAPSHTALPDAPLHTAPPAAPSQTGLAPGPSHTAPPAAPSQTALPAGPSHTAPPAVPSHTASPAAPSQTALPAGPSHTAPPEPPAQTALPAGPSHTALPEPPAQTALSTGPSHTAVAAPSHTAVPLHTGLPARPRKLRQATLSFAPAAGPAAKKAKVGDGTGGALRAAWQQRQCEQQQGGCEQQQQQQQQQSERDQQQWQQNEGDQQQQQQRQQQREGKELREHEQHQTKNECHENGLNMLQQHTDRVQQQQQQQQQQHEQHTNHVQQRHGMLQPRAQRQGQPELGKGAASTSADEHVAAALLTTTHRRVKFLAHSSVPPGFLPTIQAAVRQLGGAHIVLEGYEDARASHLVIGAERRTLKVLLAIANGAHMVTPQWITASLAAGHWLPEADFRASVRFEAVASAVRNAMAAGAPRPRPLAHRLVCVHCPPPQPTAQAEHKAPSVAECHSSISHAPVCRRGGSSGGSGSGTSVTRAALAAASAKAMEHRQGLQRLVVALGGRVVPPRACNLAVVSAGASAPSCRPAEAIAVTEEWLLQLAETHIIPSTSAFNVE